MATVVGDVGLNGKIIFPCNRSISLSCAKPLRQSQVVLLSHGSDQKIFSCGWKILKQGFAPTYNNPNQGLSIAWCRMKSVCIFSFFLYVVNC